MKKFTFILPLLIGSSLISQTALGAEAPSSNTSEVTANLTSGGLHFSSTDVDFGEIRIGEEIKSKPITVKIKDYTGSKGWSLGVHVTSSQEMQYDIIMKTGTEEFKIPYNLSKNVTSTKVSNYDEFSLTSNVNLLLKENAKVGQANSDIIWTLSPNI